jgi:transcriptional regulator with XRE-family HTH domain
VDIKELWNRANTLLKQKGYTQRSLALKCGFTERRIESLSTDGRQPSTDESVKIAAALGTTVEYLVTGDDPGKPDTTKALEHLEAVQDFLKSL